MRYDRTVIAYHGCDAEVAERLLAHEKFKKSANKYDWLGTGVYFWEYGAKRALRFAHDQKKRGKVTNPTVIGALIQLGNCFDLLDTQFTDDLLSAYEICAEAAAEQDINLPINKGDTPDKLLRYRDCFVLNWYLEQTELDGRSYDTVRGCFTEGGPAFEGSNIQRESHIQLAVRNLDCILGVFRPK
jgi:hypothetical protein